MASIFLSYAREDLGKAERLAEVLNKAGHDVWWDRHLHAGARFTAAIDEALAGADHVVVLWSSHSVESAWVQDEAAAGRDSGRLIPVLLEQVAPPLGFRQYQALDLSGWSGRGKPRGLSELVRELGAKPAAHPEAHPAAVPAAAAARHRRPTPRPAILAMLALALVAAAAAAWMWLGSPRGLELSIGAGPSADPAASREFANQVALDLTRFRSTYLESLSILEDEKAGQNVHYRAQLGIERAGPKLSANVSLMVKGRSGVSWVDTIEGRADQPIDLRQQAASTLSNVLGCAIEAEGSSAKLDSATYRLFLNGCSALSGGNIDDLVPIFTKITNSAPRFAPAFAMLALASQSSLADAPANQRPAIVRVIRAALARAKQLDPTLEEVFAADSQFHPLDKGQWDHAFPILERGLAVHPNSPYLLSLKARQLTSVGRMAEATMNARQAIGFDPLSPQMRVNFINSLVYSNRSAEAHDELAEAQAIWPNSDILEEARYRIDLRYGDPRAALERLRKSGGGDTTPIPFDQSWENFLLARIDPAPAKIEAALQSFRDRYRHDAADIPGYIQVLGTFGRADEAFQVTANPVTLDSLEASTDILFRPHMRSLLYDPRFIRLTHDLGLLAYWRKSGVWPDFCSDPQLPYDCRKEAAKYR